MTFGPSTPLKMVPSVISTTRELQEQKEMELAAEKERLLDLFRQDFEAYQKRATELQDHLRDLLRERNNLAKDFMVS